MVTFSDESTFLIGRGCRQYVRCRRGERYHSACVESFQNRSKGSVNVWGAFNWYSHSNLIKLPRRMTSQKYTEILSDNIVDNIHLHPAERPYIFQHDNCPIHTSQYTKKWLHNHNVNILPWPSVSADANCIENVWALMKRHLRKKHDIIDNAEQLYTELQRLWNKILDNNVIRHNLISSTTRRVRNILLREGSFTKY